MTNGNGHGERKVRATRESLITLTIGTLALQWMGADAAIQAGFVGGVIGVTTGFMWGNRGEHAAASDNKPTG